MSTAAAPDTAPLASSFTVQVEMLSDWHVGAGTTGGPLVDRAVIRDIDGLPFVPAKTLTGVWRDACERVALGLDDGTPDGWSRWVTFLFGDQPSAGSTGFAPHPAALSVRPARFPTSLRRALAGRPLLRDAVTFLKPGVRIDPDTGAALDEHLRFVEMARRGGVLYGRAELRQDGWSDDQKAAATALLAAGAAFADRLGGRRRRGAGRCRLRLGHLDTVEPWLDLVEHHHDTHANPPQPPSRRPPPRPKVRGVPTGRRDADWETVGCLLTPLTPLLVTREVAGNVVISLDHVPGGQLLRHVHDTFADLGVDVSDLIATARLIVTDVTAEVGEQPGRRLPLTFLQRKDQASRAVNWFRAGSDGDEPLKPVQPPGFVGVSKADSVTLIRQPLTSRTHVTVDDTLQTPRKDEGGPFTYTALAEGLRLRFEVRVPTSVANRLRDRDPSWWRRLAGEVRIGRSSKDDYGLAAITPTPPAPLSPERERTGRSQRPHDAGEQLTLKVWLLSDLLLRDARLRPTTSVDDLRRELERRIGTGVTLTIQTQQDDGRDLVAARPHRRESWHTGWGLPRPSLVGLAAGSCMVFDVTGVTPANHEGYLRRLVAIETEGLGERRAEGFGQVRFDDNLLTAGELTLQEPREDDTPPVPLVGGAAAGGYAEVIERQAWRQAIPAAAFERTARADDRHELLGLGYDRHRRPRPTRAVLGTIRDVLAALDQPGDTGVLAWIMQAAAKHGRHPHLTRLERLIASPDEVWSCLELPVDELQLTDHSEGDLQRGLWAEAVQTLVLAGIEAHLEQEGRP